MRKVFVIITFIDASFLYKSLRSKSGVKEARISKPQIDVSDLKNQSNHEATTSLRTNRKLDTTLQPASSNPHRLLNHSLRMTSVNSPSNGYNDSKNRDQVFPLLQIKTPMMDQRDNQSNQSSLYGRGFRTPIKKNVSIWDAKLIQDSNDYQKEQQMKQLQAKSNVS